MALSEQLKEMINYRIQETRQRLQPGTTEFWMIITPILTYWVVAVFYGLLDWLQLPFTERYKLVRKEEKGRPNAITKLYVCSQVLVQHALQAAFNIAFVFFDPLVCDADVGQSLLQKCTRFVLGMFVMDAWQYWIHRFMHTSTFFYKHLHSVHHQLNNVYAYGALYNSPLEALLLDTVGGLVSILGAGLTCDTATVLFVFGTMKTVLDHCGYRSPINPLHDLFPNSSAFHDVHHDIRYIKVNFSQPFFTHWDFLLGTFVDPADVHLNAKQVKANVDAGKAPNGTALVNKAAVAAPAKKTRAKATTADGANGTHAAPAEGKKTR